MASEVRIRLPRCRPVLSRIRKLNEDELIGVIGIFRKEVRPRRATALGPTAHD
jgi:hypothetical protein